MRPTFAENKFFARFVSCVRGAGLLKSLAQAAGCAMAGESFLFSPVSFGFSDDFNPALPDAKNLNGGGIFRGKISRPKTQTNKHRLEERTLPAPNT